MEKKKVLLIANPVAGRKKIKKTLNGIIDLISRNGYQTKVFTTSRKGEVINIVKDQASKMQKIICCGGDGTLNEVITGLAMINSRTPVGYIPTGTTNDFAQSLGLPKKLRKAVDSAINGHIKALDIGLLNQTHYFSYVASFGAFTKSAYATPQWLKNLIGRIAYVFYGILGLGDIRPYTVKVNVDGVEISGDFIYGSVSNSTSIGGLIKFPKSEVIFDDGVFEVLLIMNPKSFKELRSLLNGLMNNKYDDSLIHFVKASKVSFVFENSVAWTIDGEFAESTNTVSIENLYRIARVVMPSGIT